MPQLNLTITCDVPGFNYIETQARQLYKISPFKN